jgi:glycosyltransferase involved in cell wall biosynthesis
MKVAVCVITFRRPDGLKRLLEGLNALTFNQSELDELKVVVVENDAQGSVAELCQTISSCFRWQLEYYTEPIRGIPFARNTAIKHALDGVDFIAFIDDDEIPEPTWLDELLAAQRLYNADTVSGPVIPHFDQPIPDWVIKGKFFERPRHPNGHLIRGAATNNVLLRAEILRKMDKLFDERFALTGGSDWHFFLRVHRLGYKSIWADNAVVHEWVPASRVTLRWLLQRSYRLGTTESFCEVDLSPVFQTRMVCAFKGCRRIVIGAFSLPFSCLLGKHRAIKTLRYISHSMGMLSGVFGKTYDEYRTVHTV